MKWKTNNKNVHPKNIPQFFFPKNRQCILIHSTTSPSFPPHEPPSKNSRKCWILDAVMNTNLTARRRRFSSKYSTTNIPVIPEGFSARARPPSSPEKRDNWRLPRRTRSRYLRDEISLLKVFTVLGGSTRYPILVEISFFRTIFVTILIFIKFNWTFPTKAAGKSSQFGRYYSCSSISNEKFSRMNANNPFPLFLKKSILNLQNLLEYY